MTDRRYSEEEAAEIFRLAAESEHGSALALAPSQGMTLTQLREIGREAGLLPDLVERAARTLDRVPPSTRRFLGFPLGVGRVVELNREFTDSEWQRLVGELRDTFDARGVIREDGAFRQWTNGNLTVAVEPTPSGHRVRFRTVRGGARELMLMGLGLVGVGLALLLVTSLPGGPGTSLPGAGFLSLMGLGMFGVSAARLPGWARLRQRQMDALAERLVLLPEPGDPRSTD